MSAARGPARQDGEAESAVGSAFASCVVYALQSAGPGCPRHHARVGRVTTSVRVVRPDDLDALGAVLGRAYADDPVWTWVYPQPDRSRRLARMFGSLLRATRDRGATVVTDQALRGAAIWQRSDNRSLGALGNLRMATAMIASGARVRRGQAVMRAIERRHPNEPHWYLAVLGTDPAHQGEGVGSALVRHVLDDRANTGEPAYLETETEANVPFYQRHGFQVIGELDVPGGGPHLWLMWRDPQPPC
jgi:ribosomal protein S18 acetylase RimI-like enzyme